MGFDLNRHWNDPSPWAHPTLCATKDLVMGYDQDPVSDHLYRAYKNQPCERKLYASYIFTNIFSCDCSIPFL